MGVTQFLNKPEYVLRPRQILRRLRQKISPPPKGMCQVELSWGESIFCDPSEVIGHAIASYGIYDLVVSECLYRLLEPGECAVDAGANIGHMAGVMAKRAGRRGRVVCFEASSVVYRTLKKNVERWRLNNAMALIEAQHLALSDSPGIVTLYLGSTESGNHGLASLEATGAGQMMETVESVSLDGFLGAGTPVGVMKIDVEGHELGVLKGARGLLTDRRIRDIVFEDHATYPSLVHRYLEEMGYVIFRLSRTLRHLVLSPPDSAKTEPVGVLPNYLATVSADRCRERLAAGGWKLLSA